MSQLLLIAVESRGGLPDDPASREGRSVQGEEPIRQIAALLPEAAENAVRRAAEEPNERREDLYAERIVERFR
ncbi:MAG: hypothetical protein E6G20_04410 [Actinobacteria bacterium]|nr:MAG: hypothetical protein E6G20_04410 [Actinomycetota bacterium]